MYTKGKFSAMSVMAVVVMLSLGFLPAAAEAPWITKEVYDTLRVVVAEEAQSNDRLAAKEFASYWEQATGHALSVAAVPGDGINVWIGLEGTPEALLEGVDMARLIPDGLHIRTVDPNTLVILGEGERGTLNGVYEFFERFIGVRWLAPDSTFVPAPPYGPQPENPAPWERFAPDALPAIDYSYTPVFEYRWTCHNWHGTEEFARHHRLTQSPGFGLFVHTLYRLLPPDRYFETHPEYYSEINGERVAPVGLTAGDYWSDTDLRRQHGHRFGQLCVTNPDVVDRVTENLLNMMRENPTPRIWSVSQEDWDGYCECGPCSALTEAEGTPMGPLLQFVNQVAERVEAEFPEHYIETLAYTWSRQVPRTVRPRENVIIRLCSIECDFARPLNDSSAPENVRFAQDIRDWAGMAHQLYIWDYVVNFHHYHLPHPNLNVLHENIRFFADHNVRGVFEQGMGAPQVELGFIRPYLLSRLLWNPNLDYDAAKEEFIDLFFQTAGPAYRDYLDLIHRAVLEKEWTMGTFDSGGWIDKALVNEARAILDGALEAARDDAVRDRVRYEQLSVEYAALVAAPALSTDGSALVLELPESMTVEEYIALAKSFGVPEYAERMPIENLGEAVQTREAHHRKVALEIIENDRYLMWVAPELEGSVLRWRDKERDLELLRGYAEYGVRPGTWQDWHHMPLLPEGPAADIYTVVDQSDTHLTIEGVRQDGLIVRRTMHLKEGPDRVRVALELQNPTEKTLDPTVKIHPEFYDQGGNIPEIWGQKDGAWIQLNQMHVKALRPAAGQYLPVTGFNAMAFHIYKADLTLVCEFDADAVGSLLWFYNASSNAQQVNLELLPVSDPLPPGETRRMTGVYYVSDAAPFVR